MKIHRPARSGVPYFRLRDGETVVHEVAELPSCPLRQTARAAFKAAFLEALESQDHG